MVYAEDKFDCKVYWRAIKTFKSSIMRVPKNIDIPQEQKFEKQGGLLKAKNDKKSIAEACMEWFATLMLTSNPDVQNEREEKMKPLKCIKVWQFLNELL